VGDGVWLQLNKEILQGIGNKIKSLWYGLLRYCKRWEITPIDSIYPHTCTFNKQVNMDNLKLYEPSMLDQEEEKVLTSIEKLAPNAQAELPKYTVFQKRSKTTI
jgi:hypothetical protein